MNTAKLEHAVLRLPPAQRMQLALAAWESLEGDLSVASDRSFDPEGVALAIRRDQEIESGAKQAISHQDFIRLTGGKVE